MILSAALTVKREVRKVKLSCADLWFVGLVKHEHMMLIYCAPPSLALIQCYGIFYELIRNLGIKTV